MTIPENPGAIDPLFKRHVPKYQPSYFNPHPHPARPAPFSVTFPFGHTDYHARLPYYFTLVKQIENAVAAFVAPFLEEEEVPVKEQGLLPKKTFVALKNALETLQTELKEKPEAVSQGFIKELVPILAKIPTLLRYVNILTEEEPETEGLERPLQEAPSQVVLEKPQQEAPKGVPLPEKPQQEAPKGVPLPEKPQQATFQGVPLPEKPQKEVSEKEVLFKEPEKQIARQEIERNIPIFTQTLKAAVEKLPSVPLPIREAVEKYTKAPVLREFIPQAPSTLLEKEIPLFVQEGIQKAPISLLEKLPTPQRPTLPQEGRPFAFLETERQPQVVALTYPHYVPKLTPLPERNLNVPILYTVQLPIILPREFGRRNEEKGVIQPQFSTEIPFAFIVPYVPPNPIHTNNPETAKLSPRDPTQDIEENDVEGQQDAEKKVHIFAYIPRGDSQYGDPFGEGRRDEQPLRNVKVNSFAIGVYLVTNQQFADYLTRQAKKKKIQLKDRGQIFQDDKLLCQTRSGSSFSDIEPDKRKEYVGFKVLPGKESYPVIGVTYFGARAFCEEGGFRLPTEMEWEKAAGVKMTDKNVFSHKFRYGCSRDDISYCYANYESAMVDSLEPATTPVGFYNGTTVLTREGQNLNTINAESPFGCYDMSGNVWEWTDTGDGDLKVIKGGCFQSPADDLRVSARQSKDPETCDGLTGFRVALS